ncbi:putative DNA repair protein RAD51 [Blattamonas nauphoetae]|uniref:DNA repair protein RAD51 n=1 Tax=Blattamonas nauphoetae TaxID=2049346 RepID=A0ABQ9XPS5_9EUKA|nr:putative DNA repair protein RAD51 [Blattamonas nauphoetae]
MASRQLRRIRSFSDLQLQRLSNAQILTVERFLTTPYDLLMRLLDVDFLTINNLLNELSAMATPTPKTAWNLLQLQNPIPFNIPILDSHLHGGLQAGTITEIVGESSSGKTILCLQLILQSSLLPEHGGFGLSSLFIDAESSFSPRLLLSLASARISPQTVGASENENDVNDTVLQSLMSRVHVMKVSGLSDLARWAQTTLEDQIIEKKIRIVVIDSIAAIVNQSFPSGTSLIDRQHMLSSTTAQLKRAAELFGLAVVITNTAFSSSSHSPTPSLHQDSSLFLPSSTLSLPMPPPSPFTFPSTLSPRLGLLWHHSVNTRLVLVNSLPGTISNIRDRSDDNNEPLNVKLLAITKSPVTAPLAVLVQVDGTGIHQFGSGEEEDFDTS